MIKKHLPKIIELCQKYGVKKMYVCGSVLTDQFTKYSDVDFVVEYDGRLTDLRKDLAALLFRRIDIMNKKPLGWDKVQKELIYNDSK